MKALSLQKLMLGGNPLGNTEAIMLADILQSSTQQLTTLNLAYCSYIRSQGWQALFDSLKSPHCKLQVLHLSSNEIHLKDAEVSNLANALENNSVLKILGLNSNCKITASGWEAFVACLGNPGSALEEVDLGYNVIDPHGMDFFANSLRDNNKLRELILFPGCEASETPGFEPVYKYDSLADVLCNRTSISATFHSNHTLQRMFRSDIFESRREESLPNDVKSCLKLNRENTNFQSARRKIIQIHFSGFSMQHFAEMELKTLPHAIGWMAADGYGISLLFRFLRDNSSLFDCDGIAEATAPEQTHTNMQTYKWTSGSNLRLLNLLVPSLLMQIGTTLTPRATSRVHSALAK
ncbi:hypothetical protein ACHAWF_013908 [Thalassiosira exigua]